MKFKEIARDFNVFECKLHCFTVSTNMYPQLLDLPAVLLATYAIEDDVIYYTNNDSWNDCHQKLKEKCEKDFNYFKKIVNFAEKNGLEMNTFTSQFLNCNWKKVADGQIIKWYKKWVEYNTLEYSYGVLLPVLEFQDYSYAKDKLNKIIIGSKIFDKKEQVKIFNILTSPLKDSFAQKQEKDLLRLLLGYFQNKDIIDILKNNEPINAVKILERQESEFYARIVEHSKKHGWVYYVFSGPAFGPKEFVEFLQDYIRKDIHPKEYLKNLDKERSELIKKRKEYIKIMDLDEIEKEFVDYVWQFVYCKPRRKDYQSRSYYHCEFLQREIGRRLHLSLRQVRALPAHITCAWLENKNLVDENYANQAINYALCLPTEAEVEFYVGQEAKDYVDKNFVTNKDEKINNIEIIKGDTTFVGKAKGKVKIVNKSEDMSKMQVGDILVSVATTPAIVPAMKKAAAIVTDEGGLTCHAAIVSRELKIPCVVGTKIATKVFQDGDKVEVDAVNGIVKKVLS